MVALDSPEIRAARMVGTEPVMPIKIQPGLLVFRTLNLNYLDECVVEALTDDFREWGGKLKRPAVRVRPLYNDNKYTVFFDLQTLNVLRLNDEWVLPCETSYIEPFLILKQPPTFWQQCLLTNEKGAPRCGHVRAVRGAMIEVATHRGRETHVQDMYYVWKLELWRKNERVLPHKNLISRVPLLHEL